MTKIHDQIEEMQRRLTESAITEGAFVKALGDALNQVDQHLLNEVRRLGGEHESRRGAILHELQSLADRLCLFPTRQEPVAAIDHRAEAQAPLTRNGSAPHAPGDWRKATSAIEDDLESSWRSSGANH